MRILFYHGSKNYVRMRSDRRGRTKIVKANKQSEKNKKLQKGRRLLPSAWKQKLFEKSLS